MKSKNFTIVIILATFFYNPAVMATENAEEGAERTSLSTFTSHAAGVEDEREDRENIDSFKEHSRRAATRYMNLQYGGVLGGVTAAGGFIVSLLCRTGIVDEPDVCTYGAFVPIVVGGAVLMTSLTTSLLAPTRTVLRAALLEEKGLPAFRREEGPDLQSELRNRGYLERAIDRIIWDGRTDQGLNLLGIYEEEIHEN